jgi:hypothetical protein
MPVCLADILLNGMAALAVGLMAYLGWLGFKQNLKRRNDQKERQKQRRGHWGYE